MGNVSRTSYANYSEAMSNQANGKANLLLRDGRIEEARAALEAAIGVEPDSVAANLGLYELLQIKGDVPAAIEHQKRALAHQPA